jgi:mRNA interferase MazF
VGADLLRLSVAPAPVNGLTKPSWVEVDKITTVRRASLGERIGRLTPTQMVDVERLVIVFLGIAR